MKSEYIITEQELAEKGLNLNDYLLDGALIPAIINIALDTIIVPRICHLDDSINYEEDIELRLDKEPQKVKPFKTLQYAVIYRLIFMAETGPVDLYVDTIIVNQLKWGKINGFQKGLYYKTN